MTDRLNKLLTIVIPVRNEEKNLPACLENVRKFGYVVVVDSGSSDRTVEIAAEFGREVVQFRWDGHFPKKRNWLLQNYAFKTPWVMFLDADERITSAFIAEVTEKLEVATCSTSNPCDRTDAYICYYDNWFIDRLLTHGDVMHKTAILRVGAGGYERIEEDHWSHLDMEIHEHLQVKGKIGVITARLEHYDKRSLHSYYMKHDEYAAWEANRYFALRGDYSRLTRRQRLKYTHLGSWWFGLFYFVSSYFLLLGFLDGRAGFVFARSKLHYFRTIAKLIAKRSGGKENAGGKKRRTEKDGDFKHRCPPPPTFATSLAVIILIGQEKIHLRRCIERLAPLRPTCVYLIESQPDDGGVALARETAARVGLKVVNMYHKWPGLYAEQFAWAMNEVERVGGQRKVGPSAEWILRLDADEYLTEETILRLRRDLAEIPEDVAGLTLELKRWFLGGEIHYGTNGIRLLRIFRAGHAKIEQRAMDEHILVDGKVIDYNGTFYDHNLNSFDWWKEKHRGYAKREAMDAVGLFGDPERLKHPSATDRRKIKYYRFPPYLRAVLYFLMRYVVHGGFLDGRIGWRWHFWQGLWYRWLVDREIARLRRAN